MSLGFGEILLILFIVLLIFGAKRLPELARGLGQGMREFKKATSEIQDEITSASNLDAPAKKADQSSASKKEA
ncbi:MAG: twin-arginine translocase TatA/TatE family subunit [Candidatus Marinimicrobia bacterium]|nr:twin-arginine translocase TatA/TatE family subunit [Candidatus Neomarinimicrobiota bacterium]